MLKNNLIEEALNNLTNVMYANMYLAVIDDPSVYDADFDYTLCSDKEMALDYILTELDRRIMEENIDLSFDDISHLDAFESIAKELKIYNSIEFEGIFYRIKKLDFYK